MHKATRTITPFLAALLIVAGTGSASAGIINWLVMSPPAYGSSVPNNSVYNVPGIGLVTVTYSIPANITNTRLAGAGFQSGSIGLTSWSNYEDFATIFTDGPDPLVPVPWSITYTFPGLLPPGSVYVGSIGLGKTTSFGGGASIFTVNQNGVFLGDYTDGGPWGPTAFSSGAGTFSLQNSVSGPGGQNPWWNTPLGVVRIADPVSSLTINCSQIRGDGIGVNIGFDVDVATPTNSGSWGRLKSLYR